MLSSGDSKPAVGNYGFGRGTTLGSKAGGHWELHYPPRPAVWTRPTPTETVRPTRITDRDWRRICDGGMHERLVSRHGVRPLQLGRTSRAWCRQPPRLTSSVSSHRLPPFRLQAIPTIAPVDSKRQAVAEDEAQREAGGEAVCSSH